VAGCCAEDATANARNTRTGTGQVNRRPRRMEVRIAKGFNGILLSYKDEDSINGSAITSLLDIGNDESYINKKQNIQT
jgi:hypothetical protein